MWGMGGTNPINGLPPIKTCPPIQKNFIPPPPWLIRSPADQFFLRASKQGNILMIHLPHCVVDLSKYTVCLKGQVKIYLLITRARKHSKTLERWHFLH